MVHWPNWRFLHSPGVKGLTDFAQRDINLLTATMEASKLGSSPLFPCVNQVCVVQYLRYGWSLTAYILCYSKDYTFLYIEK